MPKDHRYDTVKTLIEEGIVNSIPQAFNYIPLIIVSKRTGIDYGRFRRLVKNPGLFTLGELIRLAELFDVDSRTFSFMAYDYLKSHKKSGKSKN